MTKANLILPWRYFFSYLNKFNSTKNYQEIDNAKIAQRGQCNDEDHRRLLSRSYRQGYVRIRDDCVNCC